MKEEKPFGLILILTGTAGILHRLTNRCFAKCAKEIHNPQLNSAEMLCLDRCAYKYMLSVNVVGQRMQVFR